MSTSYGVVCLDCNKGFCTMSRGYNDIIALLSTKDLIGRIVATLEELEVVEQELYRRSLSFTELIFKMEVSCNDRTEEVRFIGTHAKHTLWIVDEYGNYYDNRGVTQKDATLRMARPYEVAFTEFDN